jgi:hypothetical protein
MRLRIAFGVFLSAGFALLVVSEFIKGNLKMVSLAAGLGCAIAAFLCIRRAVRLDEDQVTVKEKAKKRRVLLATRRQAKNLIMRTLVRAAAPADGLSSAWYFCYHQLLSAGRADFEGCRELCLSGMEERIEELSKHEPSPETDNELEELEAAVALLATYPDEWTRLVREAGETFGVGR